MSHPDDTSHPGTAHPDISHADISYAGADLRAADVQELVARSADAADLHAAVPALLLELQTSLGALTASVTAATERGRRPFRPGPDWEPRLGDLAYGVFLLADQTGADVAQLVAATARELQARVAPVQATAENSWPLPE